MLSGRCKQTNILSQNKIMGILIENNLNKGGLVMKNININLFAHFRAS